MTKCFLIEETGNGANYLRRYSTGDNLKCGERNYHDAQVFYADALEIYEIHDGNRVMTGSENIIKPPYDDPRWPTQCMCGYQFTENDHYQLYHDSYMIRKVDQVIKTFDEWQQIPGAMWDAYWYPWKGSDGKSLVVILPNLTPWSIDGPASNCNEKDIVHNCWIRTGEAPDINVTKGGTPNHAGGGSIQAKSYHGFLQNGFLT